MSPPASPDPASAAPAYVVFHHLTAAFNYRIDGADTFTHSGQYPDYSFEIVLRPYDNSPAHFEETVQYADDGVRQRLREERIHFSNYFASPATYFLLFDIRHPAGTTPEQCLQSPLFGRIHSAIMNVLRLCSSAGLQWHRTFYYRHPPSQMGGLVSLEPNTSQVRFSHLGTPSVLQHGNFDDCRRLFDILLLKNWNDGTTFTNVLNLALEYHRLAFTLENVAHAFLILVVVYEALFKKESENVTRPSKRIARLLGRTKRECQDIQREFNDDPVNSFCKIRNRIAHGDPSLNVSMVAGNYPLLYRHVTDALLALLSLPAGTLDSAKDYYDEIGRVVDARFDTLPKV